MSRNIKDKQCQAIGTHSTPGREVCDKQETIPQIILPLALQKYINGRQSQYLSDMKVAFHASTKPKTMLAEVKVMRQSAEQANRLNCFRPTWTLISRLPSS
jgi:hypothetical protein